MDIIVRKPTPAELEEFEQNPVWECKPSTFNWFFDNNEIFLVIEGDATIEYDGRSIPFAKGDLVICPKGLTCIWNVKRTIKRRYQIIK
jgi:uncharacterized cupin superfamily protein